MSKVKAGVQLASKGTGYALMPKTMQTSLENKSLNAGIEDGSITDLGDGDGNLFHTYDNVDGDGASCAIINGFRVPCSSTLNQQDGADLKDILGDLTFGGGISPETLNGKPNPNAGKAWFNLGMPRNVATTADDSVNVAKYAVA